MCVDSSNKNALIILLDKLKLEHLHLIECDGIQYKSIISAIKKTESLKSLTFVPSESATGNTINVPVFTQLTNARKLSSASRTLDIFLSTVEHKLVRKNASLQKKITKTGDQIVKLRKLADENNYIRKSLENDV